MKRFIIYYLLFTIFCAITYAEKAMFNSLNVGETTPKISARTDIEKYYSGSQVLENFYCKPWGGVTKRPGTYYIYTIPSKIILEEEIPEVPPSQTRPEAYVASNQDDVVWFDPDYAVLSYDSVSVGTTHNLSSCIAIDSQENVVAGTASNTTDYKIVKWDSELNKSVDSPLFVPDAGWSSGQGVFSVKFSPDDAYLYAMAGETLYKFDTSDGSEVWHVAGGEDSGHTMQVDASGNIHCGGKKIDSDGNTLVTYTFIGTNVAGAGRSSFYDENTTTWMIGGGWVYWQAGEGWRYPKIRSQIDSNDDGKEWLTSSNSAVGVYGILVVGDYVYAGHEYNINGVGYSITKLDFDFNTIAGYDAEGMAGGHLWIDHDGNIACLVGRWDGGDPNAGVWTFDTDLNFIAKHLYASDDFYGNEAVNVPYMDEGTPGTPEVSYQNNFGEGEPAPTRLISFTGPDETSYAITMGNGYMSFLKDQ